MDKHDVRPTSCLCLTERVPYNISDTIHGIIVRDRPPVTFTTMQIHLIVGF